MPSLKEAKACRPKSHGVRSVGVATIERWCALLGRARRRGDFLGVDTRAYPADFATCARYYTDFRRKIATRYARPAPLTLVDLNAFLAEQAGRHAVQWHEGAQTEQTGISRPA